MLDFDPVTAAGYEAIASRLIDRAALYVDSSPNLQSDLAKQITADAWVQSELFVLVCRLREPSDELLSAVDLHIRFAQHMGALRYQFEVLETFAPKNPFAMTLLESLADAADNGVRRWAESTLERLAQKNTGDVQQFQNAVLSAAADRNDFHQKELASTLRNHPHLLQHVKNVAASSTEARCAAASMLGEAAAQPGPNGAPNDAREELISYLSDSSHQVKKQAAIALSAAVESPEVIEALLSVLQEILPHIRKTSTEEDESVVVATAVLRSLGKAVETHPEVAHRVYVLIRRIFHVTGRKQRMGRVELLTAGLYAVAPLISGNRHLLEIFGKQLTGFSNATFEIVEAISKQLSIDDAKIAMKLEDGNLNRGCAFVSMSCFWGSFRPDDGRPHRVTELGLAVFAILLNRAKADAEALTRVLHLANHLAGMEAIQQIAKPSLEQTLADNPETAEALLAKMLEVSHLLVCEYAPASEHGHLIFFEKAVLTSKTLRENLIQYFGTLAEQYIPDPDEVNIENFGDDAFLMSHPNPLDEMGAILQMLRPAALIDPDVIDCALHAVRSPGWTLRRIGFSIVLPEVKKRKDIADVVIELAVGRWLRPMSRTEDFDLFRDDLSAALRAIAEDPASRSIVRASLVAVQYHEQWAAALEALQPFAATDPEVAALFHSLFDSLSTEDRESDEVTEQTVAPEFEYYEAIDSLYYAMEVRATIVAGAYKAAKLRPQLAPIMEERFRNGTAGTAPLAADLSNDPTSLPFCLELLGMDDVSWMPIAQAIVERGLVDRIIETI